jgi:hypothetical protein
VDPTCTGGCPGTQVCTQRITIDPIDPNIVDYSCECVAPQPEACCFADGHCEMHVAAECLLIGGTPKGPGTLCLGDNSGNGIDDACEILDKVVCEPQGGLNPSHPSTYWYDVTPTGFGRCDFHVRVYDPNPNDYTNVSMPAFWAFLVHQVGLEWWASWWDTDTANCSHAFSGKTRFQFDNPNAKTWGDWSTTIGNSSEPDDDVVDRSANHPAETNGSGYRVHVPLPPGVVTQACCLQNGTCVEVEYNKCVALGGDPQGPNTICDMRVCNPLKWAQPPTYNVAEPGAQCFWGWNEHSHYQSPGCAIVADDWACDTDRPITDIHWWGSYQNWTAPEPPPPVPGFPDSFHIGIWTDVPRNVDRPFSHPGKMIWESIVPRMALNERYVGCDQYPGQPLDTCFRYDFTIPEAGWFYQALSTDPTIYWISISAWYLSGPPEQPFIWGWKTREHFFNDDAVRIFAPNPPTIGSEFIEGTPIVTPDGESWDMAFVLTTDTPGPSKWDQWPDVSLRGLHASDGITLADNWECTGGLVTDLHWWGNYELDGLGHEKRGAGIQCINLSIHANRPEDPWCLPQDPELWGVCALFSALNEHDTGMVNIEGSKIYEYTFYLNPGWAQTPGDIYWLDIEAQSIKPANPALWRWQENSRDAAPRLCPAAERTLSQAWHTIQWGEMPPFRYSEMAFRITSGPYPLPNTIVWDPATNPTPWPNNNPDATTRSLRFRVTGPDTPSTVDAIQVTMVNLQDPQPPNAICCPPKNFGCWETGAACGTILAPVPPAVGVCTGTGETGGCARWVGKPGTFYEAQGPPLSGPYRAARLQCSPFYADWVAETASGPITVVGAEIMPSSEYSVKTYAASCAGNEDTCTNVSAAVPMYTRRSGDAETAYNPPGTGTQPDASDVTALVNKFKNLAGAPVKARSQLQPNLPELNTDVSATDIVAVVDAYKGFAYPYGGPCPCPSLVTCGVTACPGGAGTCTGSGLPGLGAESMCVKTCSVSGAPCIGPEHCPSGETCGNPFCRDKCGRCTPP